MHPGATITGLRLHYRSSNKRIRAILRQQGVEVRRSNQGRPQGGIEVAVAAYGAGHTFDEAARLGRVGFNPLRRVLCDRMLLRRTGETRRLRELMRATAPPAVRCLDRY